jgi:hypothetical protein
VFSPNVAPLPVHDEKLYFQFCFWTRMKIPQYQKTYFLIDSLFTCNLSTPRELNLCWLCQRTASWPYSIYWTDITFLVGRAISTWILSLNTSWWQQLIHSTTSTDRAIHPHYSIFFDAMTSCGVVPWDVIWLQCSRFSCTVLMYERLGPVCKNELKRLDWTLLLNIDLG